MKLRPANRTLAFERLETKASPAAMLLAVAPLDAASHQAIEPTVEELRQQLVDVSTNWQYQHSLSTLLEFVEEQTRAENQESGEPAKTTSSTPSLQDCQRADAMMELSDPNLISLVMTEAPARSALGAR